MAVFVQKPKEKLMALFTHFILVYHPTKAIQANRPELSLDLHKFSLDLEGAKENVWKLRSTS